MKVKSGKQKGSRLQKFVKDSLTKAFGLGDGDLESRPAGPGEDIMISPHARKLLGNISIECKNNERLELWKALEQAEANSGSYHPILVFKRNRSKVYAAIEFEFLQRLLLVASVKGKSYEDNS